MVELLFNSTPKIKRAIQFVILNYYIKKSFDTESHRGISIGNTTGTEAAFHLAKQ